MEKWERERETVTLKPPNILPWDKASFFPPSHSTLLYCLMFECGPHTALTSSVRRLKAGKAVLGGSHLCPCWGWKDREDARREGCRGQHTAGRSIMGRGPRE